MVPTARGSLTGAFLALATALTACANRPKRRIELGDEDPVRNPSVSVTSTGWMNRSFDRADPGTAPVGADAPGDNAALRPGRPWMGSVGVAGFGTADYEVGGGFLVPDPDAVRSQTAAGADRIRDTGVGLWMKFDF